MHDGDEAETILVVDADPLVLKTCSQILSHASFKVLTAINAGDALDLCWTFWQSIDIALLDVMMPGMNGPELAEHIIKLHPEASLVFMSGYQDYQVEKSRPFGSKWFLRKPFKAADLVTMIEDSLKEGRKEPRKRGPGRQGTVTRIRKASGES